MKSNLRCPLWSNYYKSLQYFGIVNKVLLTSDPHSQQKQPYSYISCSIPTTVLLNFMETALHQTHLTIWMSTMENHQIPFKWLYQRLQISINPNSIATFYIHTRFKLCDVLYQEPTKPSQCLQFNINNYIKFVTGNTHLAFSNKLQQTR